MDNAQTVTFEINGIQGSLTVPRVLSPEDFDRWYTQSQVNDGEVKLQQLSPALAWERLALERIHMLRSYDFPIGPTLAEMQDGARPLPAVAVQIVAATTSLITDATRLPKLPGASSAA